MFRKPRKAFQKHIKNMTPQLYYHVGPISQWFVIGVKGYLDKMGEQRQEHVTKKITGRRHHLAIDIR